MPVSQISPPLPRPRNAWQNLEKFLNERRATRVPVEEPESFERQPHALFTAAEAEALGEKLAKFDIDAPVVERSDDPMVQPADIDDRESEPSFLTKLLSRVAFVQRPRNAPLVRRAAPRRRSREGLRRFGPAGRRHAQRAAARLHRWVCWLRRESARGDLRI